MITAEKNDKNDKDWWLTSNHSCPLIIFFYFDMFLKIVQLIFLIW